MRLEEKQALVAKVLHGIEHSFNEHRIPPDVGLSALGSGFVETAIDLDCDKEDVFEIVDFLYDRISSKKLI